MLESLRGLFFTQACFIACSGFLPSAIPAITSVPIFVNTFFISENDNFSLKFLKDSLFVSIPKYVAAVSIIVSFALLKSTSSPRDLSTFPALFPRLFNPPPTASVTFLKPLVKVAANSGGRLRFFVIISLKPSVK